MTHISKTTLPALLLASLFLPHAALGVSTRTFRTSSYKEFDEGEAKNAIITSLGEVIPGRKTTRVDLETDAAWTAVRAPDGTIYAGSVTNGSVYVVSGGQKKILANLDKDTPWIGALVLLDGTLYAGTLGTASLHAMDPKTGKTTKLLSLPGAEHVWALVPDPAGKILYAATGPEGKLFAVDVAAKSAKVLWNSEEPHLLSAAPAADGALWIGTSEEAVLYRFDPKTGQARAIADFAGTEVKAVVEVDGATVVAVNEFEQKSSSPPAPPVAKGPKGTTAKAPDGSAPGTDKGKGSDVALPPRAGERKGKGALFRVEPDGRVEQLHSLAEGYFQSLAVTSEGHVLAGAGTGGRVYEVRTDRSVLTAFDVDERQVNVVIADRHGVTLVTGDGAAVYTTTGLSKDAVYTSKVFDGQFPARWGNLRWRGDESLVMETRSGNTSKPDRGWSPWQRVTQETAAGPGLRISRIVSPPGRYFQYRTTLSAHPAATLREVTAYYLPQNQRARVTEVQLGDAAEASKRPAVTTQPGPAKPRSPILRLKWKVENPDDDELLYVVEYRAEGEVDWRPLPVGPEPLTKPELEWNTEALPDGYFRIRVTASDERSNPKDYALSHSLISDLFLVDNQKPQVTGIEVKYPFASARSVDSFSRIDEIAYSIDGGDFVMWFPKDGVFDDVAEVFTIKLPDRLKPGTHSLAIRVADEADNIGATSVSFRVGK
ncbi:MAG: hypothetical protein HY698_04330 [Deltaproteobacteria bacterium]|nr:hypothetical protein [Deltaproteobacteria bacterium]